MENTSNLIKLNLSSATGRDATCSRLFFLMQGWLLPPQIALESNSIVSNRLEQRKLEDKNPDRVSQRYSGQQRNLESAFRATLYRKLRSVRFQIVSAMKGF
ncbi:hypothetical protein QL285_054609 [Trifolium repens]|nr:hypothetical protein QL285_054609 [Trifolium repens]